MNDTNEYDDETPTETRELFVGVNLLTQEVVAVALFPDLIRDAYVLRGSTDAAGRIILDPDRSWNGREATEVCLASQGCGLGWQFVAGDEVSVENRNLSSVWSES